MLLLKVFTWKLSSCVPSSCGEVTISFTDAIFKILLIYSCQQCWSQSDVKFVQQLKSWVSFLVWKNYLMWAGFLGTKISFVFFCNQRAIFRSNMHQKKWFDQNCNMFNFSDCSAIWVAITLFKIRQRKSARVGHCYFCREVSFLAKKSRLPFFWSLVVVKWKILLKKSCAEILFYARVE